MRALAPRARLRIVLPSGRPAPAAVPALTLRARRRRRAEGCALPRSRPRECLRAATGRGPASAPEEGPRQPVAVPGPEPSGAPAHRRAARRLTTSRPLRRTASRPRALPTPIGESLPALRSEHGPRHDMHRPAPARPRRDLAPAPERVVPLPPAPAPVCSPQANEPPARQPVLVPLASGDREPVSGPAKRLEADLPQERDERQRSARAPSAPPSLAASAPAWAEAEPAQAQGVRPPRPRPSAPFPVSRSGAHVAAGPPPHPAQRDEAHPPTALAERQSAAPEPPGQLHPGAPAPPSGGAGAVPAQDEQPQRRPRAGPSVISGAVAQVGKACR